MKEQYIRQVKKELHLSRKDKKEIVRDVRSFYILFCFRRREQLSTSILAMENRAQSALLAAVPGKRL